MNPLLIKARSVARRLGLIRLIHRLRPATAYEARFHEALMQAIREGDTVWDVGANVGLYTEQFCRWVGPNGVVVAFEPSLESCETLRRRLAQVAGLISENIALGDSDRVGHLVVDGGSVENHLASEADLASADVTVVAVPVSRGDTVCARLGRTPNVIKIDVEGFEEEVLTGMPAILSSPALRSVLVEVHFLKLEQRGRADAPLRIEKLLRGHGLKTRWVDSSHLVGNRYTESGTASPRKRRRVGEPMRIE